MIALAYLGPYLPALAAGLVWLAVLLRRAERRGGEGAPALQPARPLGRLVGEFWRFTGPRGLAAIFQTTSLWLNTLLIGALRSTKEAGVYAASSRYLAMAAMAAVAIRQVLAPKLSELLARRSTERASAAYQTTTSWMVALNWPIYLALLTFGPVLLAGVRPRLRRRRGGPGRAVGDHAARHRRRPGRRGPADGRPQRLEPGQHRGRAGRQPGPQLRPHPPLRPGRGGGRLRRRHPAQQPAPAGPGVAVDGPAPVRAGHRGGRGPVGGQLRAARAWPCGPCSARPSPGSWSTRGRLRAVRGPAVALPRPAGMGGAPRHPAPPPPRHPVDA